MARPHSKGLYRLLNGRMPLIHAAFPLAFVYGNSQAVRPTLLNFNSEAVLMSQENQPCEAITIKRGELAKMAH
jgi:hypothetical protein